MCQRREITPGERGKMICPNCGNETDERLRFCTGCGTEIAPTVRQPTAAQPPPTPPTAPPATPQQQPPRRPPVERYPAQAQAPPAETYRTPSQPTTRIPAQQYVPPAQQYQQQAAGYGAPYAAQPGYGATGARYGSVVLGAITMVMGALVAASVFLSWVSVMGFGATGWSMMIHGAAGQGVSTSGFHVVVTGSGLIFFTGFLAMLLGVLITVGGLVLLFNSRAGGVLTLLFGVTATAIAAINITMVYTKMQPVSPGVGLWVFAGASLVALVLGIVGMASPG
ncbi:MAG: zinc ribbon domain-containing protein [Actinobacteria bacterium]|nr:zinc ribbon domain-containing protein [Actinomycetota bacterium]MBU4302373.1 zinc ribbon domain-containing protein [Actinomycetota bacterium]MBU4489091.1 zinc ribbon domain-containing protein [Actinomycetota bacterium]